MELVDGPDGSHIWGDRYSRRMSDLFGVQEEITREITEKLRLSQEERDRLARRRNNNTAAYQLYRKGQFYWLKGGLSLVAQRIGCRFRQKPGLL